MMNSMSAEATIVRNYFDWLVAMPWGKYNKVKSDIKSAKAVLDKDHYRIR